MSKKEELWNTQQVADYLGVHPTTIRHRIKHNELPHEKFLKRYQFKKSEIDKWIAKQTTQVTA